MYRENPIMPVLAPVQPTAPQVFLDLLSPSGLQKLCSLAEQGAPTRQLVPPGLWNRELLSVSLWSP